MLEDRKYKVLRAVINSYISSAKPVGSNTISKEYNLGVSSATIRNEMSDLENLGYLNKPHTSAGRVPSDKAYRFYVNYILDGRKFLSDSNMLDLEDIFDYKAADYDSIIKTSSKVLSSLTSYTALVISPQIKKEKLKLLKLILIEENTILLILVTDLQNVKNKIFTVSEPVEQEDLNAIAKILNDKLVGSDLANINNIFNMGILHDKGFNNILESIHDLVKESLEETRNIEIHTEGVNRIFDHPEYNNIEKAKSLISFIEDRDLLIKAIVKNNLDSGTEVTIGDENIFDPLKESTLITTSYRVGDKTIGKLGVVGPTRMDYLNIIGLLEVFSYNLTKILASIEIKE